MTPVPRRPPLPSVTADQMREVDRILVEEVGLQLVQMMESAGRHLAELAVTRFAPRSCTVLVGSGGNGGGGMVTARHLRSRGVDVAVVPVRTTPAGVPGEQLELLRKIGVPVRAEPHPADLVIDAVLGYGGHDDPTGRAGRLVAWAAEADALVLALDVPSGLDATTGQTGDPCVHAAATLTLGLPKRGLALAPPHVTGAVYTADIGVPDWVYARIGVDVRTPFAAEAIVADGRSGHGSVV